MLRTQGVRAGSWHVAAVPDENAVGEDERGALQQIPVQDARTEVSEKSVPHEGDDVHSVFGVPLVLFVFSPFAVNFCALPEGPMSSVLFMS